MGLCKCPKRRVTNQFCFEHRVNVCEHCMVTNHPKCVVQSYIQWLQDSDYNAVCEICNLALGNQECIRLTCYHVFHWSCLESTFRKFPRTTAPAGYQCLSCRSPLFPSSNLVSPVADVLREKLAGVNWARAGLGLSLLSDDVDSGISHSNQMNMDNQYGPNGYMIHSTSNENFRSDSLGSSTPHRASPIGASDDENNARKSNGPPYSVVQVQDDNIFDSTSYGGSAHTTRKLYEASEPVKQPAALHYDHDENKYKRKSASERLVRWWKNTLPPARKRTSGPVNRRCILTLILMFLLSFVIIFILLKIGRASVESDPSLNINLNPNIRIQAEA